MTPRAVIVVPTLLLFCGALAIVGQETQPTTDQIGRINDLVKILTAPDTDLPARKIAAGMLMREKSSAAFNHLNRILTDPKDRTAQLAVIGACAERDDPDPRFIKPLIGLLLGTDREIQKAAAAAIGRYRDGDLIAQLSKIVSTEKRPLGQKLAAILALGKTRSKASVGALIKLMKVPCKDPQARKQIKLACAKGLNELTFVDYGTNIAAWEAWWAQRKSKTELQWVQGQLDVLTEENRALQNLLNRTEQAMIEATVGLFHTARKDPADQIKTIQAYLASRLPAQRRAALVILSDQIRKNQKLPGQLLAAVRKLLADDDPTVRRECTRVLVEGNDTGAVKDLRKQLDNEIEPPIKQAILIAIGQLGSSDCLPDIIRHLRSPLEPVALGAATAIGRMSQNKHPPETIKDQAVEAVIKRYQNTNDEQLALKEALLRTMIILADRRFLAKFKLALTDTEPDLRRYGAQGIAALNDPGQVDLLLERLASDPASAVRAEIATGIAALTDDRTVADRLADRIDPKVETNEDVRQVIWQAVMTMVKRWPVARQLEWTEQLFTRATWIDDGFRHTILSALAAKIDAQSPAWKSALRVDVFSRCGRLMLKTSRPTDAVNYFRQALTAAKQDPASAPDQLADDFAQNILDAMTDKPNEILAAKFLNSVPGLLSRKKIEAITDRFVHAMHRQGDRQRPEKFLAQLSDNFKKALSQDYRNRLSATIQTAPSTQTSRPAQ